MPPPTRTVELTAEHLSAVECPLCDEPPVTMDEPIPVTGEREDQRIGYLIAMRCADQHEFSLMVAPYRDRMWVTLTWEADAGAHQP